MIAKTRALLLPLALLLFAAGCQSQAPKRIVQAAKDDFRHLPADLWQDTTLYFSSTENAVVLITGGAASWVARHNWDDPAEKHFDNHNTFPRDFTIALGAIPAAELTITGVGYMYGAAAENDELRSVAHAMIEAQIMNGIYTGLLKAIAQDTSPNGEGRAWPSGHTSIAVTFATVLNEYYGPWVGLPLYTLAGFVAYERMDSGEHWASDVIFGAALGYTIGKTVASKYEPEIFGMRVMPFMDPVNGAAGFALMKRF